MTRPLASTVLEALVADLAVSLSRWCQGSTRSDVDRLASCLSTTQPVAAVERRHFNKAARELRESFSLAPGGQAATLETWVTRYLLPGRDMLLSEADSKKMLARARDRLAREKKTASGMHSARIEMPAASWDRLQEIQMEEKLNSRARTLEAIIGAYKLKAKRKGQSVVRPITQRDAEGKLEQEQGSLTL